MRAVETAIRDRFRQWQDQYLATSARLDEAMTETAIRDRLRKWRSPYQATGARLREQDRQPACYFAHRCAARHGGCKVARGNERRRDGVGVRFLHPELPVDLVDQE